MGWFWGGIFPPLFLVETPIQSIRSNFILWDNHQSESNQQSRLVDQKKDWSPGFVKTVPLRTAFPDNSFWNVFPQWWVQQTSVTDRETWVGGSQRPEDLNKKTWSCPSIQKSVISCCKLVKTNFKLTDWIQTLHETKEHLIKHRFPVGLVRVTSFDIDHFTGLAVKNEAVCDIHWYTAWGTKVPIGSIFDVAISSDTGCDTETSSKKWRPMSVWCFHQLVSADYLGIFFLKILHDLFFLQAGILTESSQVLCNEPLSKILEARKKRRSWRWQTWFLQFSHFEGSTIGC